MKRVATWLAMSTLLLAACSSGGSDRGDVAADRGATFTLSEWKITPPSTQLQPGRQPITANNVGGETHELVIVSAGDVKSLPTNTDGSVNEDELASVTVGEIADVPAGSSKTKTLTFSRGTYVAFCNIVDQMGSGGMMDSGGMGNGNAGGMDHVHFALGMATTFTVG